MLQVYQFTCKQILAFYRTVAITKELHRTKLIAKNAVGRISKLENKLSESIIERDRLLVEHKNETSLMRASDAFHKGNNALLTKNYNKAIIYYKKTIELRPADAHAFNNLGNAYKEIQNYPLAIKAYRNAILHKPDYASAHYNLGIVYQKNNNFDPKIGLSRGDFDEHRYYTPPNIAKFLSCFFLSGF